MNYEHLTLGVEDSMKRGQSCAVADSGARILAQFPGIWDGCPGFSRAQKVSPVTFFSGFRMVLPLRSMVGRVRWFHWKCLIDQTSAAEPNWIIIAPGIWCTRRSSTITHCSLCEGDRDLASRFPFLMIFVEVCGDIQCKWCKWLLPVQESLYFAKNPWKIGWWVPNLQR